jgi:hypothetical protein
VGPVVEAPEALQQRSGQATTARLGDAGRAAPALHRARGRSSLAQRGAERSLHTPDGSLAFVSPDDLNLSGTISAPDEYPSVSRTYPIQPRAMPSIDGHSPRVRIGNAAHSIAQRACRGLLVTLLGPFVRHVTHRQRLCNRRPPLLHPLADRKRSSPVRDVSAHRPRQHIPVLIRSS